MVSTYEYCEVRCYSGTAVVFVEVCHHSIFRWHCSDIEVISISDSLKVTTDDEEVNSVPAFGPTAFFYRGIDGMKGSMALR